MELVTGRNGNVAAFVTVCGLGKLVNGCSARPRTSWPLSIRAKVQVATSGAKPDYVIPSIVDGRRKVGLKLAQETRGLWRRGCQDCKAQAPVITKPLGS